MHYLAALRSGISVDNLAREFAQELVNTSVNACGLCLSFACDFVNDTLLAIGLVCEITPDHIGVGSFPYQWPKEQLLKYIFRHNELEFRCVEQFLVAMSRAMGYINPECYDDIVATNDSEIRDFETPVEYFMEIIAVWCNVYKHLLAAGDYGTSNMFVEPLARINMQLFVGTNDIRIAYRNYFPLLDKICSRLCRSALQGLRYPMTHDVTLRTLLKIISHDFDVFSEEATLFFSEALMVQCDTSTYPTIFQELKNMLKENHGNRLQILTNILIKPEILDVFYDVLVSKKGKSIIGDQQMVLKLINVLQSKLMTFDCFSLRFMESILILVTRAPPSIGSLACKLYMSIMKQKTTDVYILGHIIDFYISHVANTSHLSYYFSQFYKHFEYVREVYKFLDIISWHRATESQRLLCAHIIVAIFKIKFELKDASDTITHPHKELESFLLILPQKLVTIPCQQIIGILLQLFEFVSVDSLKKETIDNFIHYAVDAFKRLDNKFEYPLLMNIFIIFHKCLDVVKEWQHLELLGNFLMVEYRQAIKELARIQQQHKKVISKSCFTRLCYSLKRVSIIIKTCCEVFDFLPEIINSLEKYVLTTYSVDFIGPCWLNQTSTFIDIYALEVVTSCIIKLYKEETSTPISTSFAYRMAQQISEHLARILKNGEQFLKLPEFRMKAYFCCLLNFYCQLPIKMSSNTYHHMTHILIFLNLIAKSGDAQSAAIEELQQTHIIQKNEYIRVMFRHFGEMHKYDHIEIKSNIVWKLCQHFGKPESKFNEELKDLLKTLATYRFEIYKHIMAVLVNNIHRQRPPLKRLIVTLLLRKHKHLIDNELTVESSTLVKLHIVLSVLQTIEKTLNVKLINDRYNRIEALNHLSIFMKGLPVNALHANHLIVEQVGLLKKHLLTASEHRTLNRFLLEVQKI